MATPRGNTQNKSVTLELTVVPWGSTAADKQKIADGKSPRTRTNVRLEEVVSVDPYGAADHTPLFNGNVYWQSAAMREQGISGPMKFRVVITPIS